MLSEGIIEKKKLNKEKILENLGEGWKIIKFRKYWEGNDRWREKWEEISIYEGNVEGK